MVDLNGLGVRLPALPSLTGTANLLFLLGSSNIASSTMPPFSDALSTLEI